MNFFYFILLGFTIATAIASDEHRPKLKIKEDPRGKRNLEYSISHNYPIGSNFRLERRIASGPPNFQLPSRHTSFFPPSRPYVPNSKRGRPHSVPAPPYAVQMEPLVQYSQRDPLYDTSKLSLTAEGHTNDLSKPEDLLQDNNQLSENYYGPNNHHHQPVYYQKEPEPIIEIIIKESNVTLPPVPVPTLPPKKKEPVQVFYVKYKKNPNGHGKDSVIYDKPIPALTPHVQEDPEEEAQLDQPHQEYVTAPPAPSTTLRTIIRPESETYIGTSGIHVTFGSEKKIEKPSVEGHEESAPQPAVAFPQQQHFSQPPPERKPHTSAFPPNFNSPTNFNQHAFNPRPQQQFQNNQYRPVFQQNQQIRSFPPNHQQRLNGPAPPPPPPHPQRPFQNQQQFPPRPLNPPIPSQHRPVFNPPPPPQFPPNHQFPNQNSQFPPNHHFPQNHQFPPNHQFVQNHKPPANQFTSQSFQYNFPPQPNPKPQFSQILNQRPHTHFPVLQQQLPQSNPAQPFNNKPQIHNEPPKQIQFQQHHHQPQHHHQQQQQQQQQHQQQQQQQQHHHQQQQQQKQQQFNSNQQFNQQFQNHNLHNFNVHQPLQQTHQQQQQQQQLQQQQQPFFPPGGELFKSVPKYEQHISIPDTTQQQQQLTNSQGVAAQALPQIQNHPQIPNNQQHINHQQQQLQAQSLQLQQQQQNIQIQEQLKQQEQLSQQQKNLSPQDFHQQIQQQFQQFPQNFAQLSHVQNKQNSQQQTTNYFLQNQQKSLQSSQNTPTIYQTSSTVPSSTTTQPTTTKAPEKTEEKKKELPLNIQLPDEVPDDLREQLLSSGILNNADISVLDYDKVGDIPIEALPPDQLANFYGAGGAQQISASENKETIVKPDEEPIKTYSDQELVAEASEMDEQVEKADSPKTKPPVEMKVVHYDAETIEGKAVEDSYVRDDATQVDPVVLNDNKYNRYLPLKVSGANFPIPDVPELKGRNITSVVVLAPVDYDFQPHQHGDRSTRDIEGDLKDVRLLAGEALKEVLKMPSKENYNKWLEKEKETASDKQSVILLVTGSPDSKEKEIFMYDVASKTVSKLSGELSSAFVEAAESNSDDEETIPLASEIQETKVEPPTNSHNENTHIMETKENRFGQRKTG